MSPTSDQVDLVVDVAGELTLPSELLTRLRLATGDLIALESGPLSVRLDLYRDFVATGWEGLSPETARHIVEEYLCHPLTAVLPGGRLPIHDDVLTLAVGDRLVLQVRATGLHHELFLFRASADVET
jgi:hypothetical protein